MKLLELYNLHSQGEITDEQAAEYLGTSVAMWKSRLTKWGHRLPLALSLLDKVSEGKISTSEAAEALGITLRNFSKLVLSWRVTKPIKPYLVQRAVSEVKWEIRKKAAIDFIAGSCTIEEAAEQASVTDRQMRRWVSDLLDKHFGMVFKDLKQLHSKRRERLATEIEEAERLELAKQQALKPIINGQKSLQEEALERVLHRRAPRRVNVR